MYVWEEINMSEVKEKCFVIMPISNQGDYPKGHFQKVYEQIFKPAIEDAGYEAFRVDEDNMCTPIVEKIFKAIQECPMALCDLSNRNPNVLYELGIRQAYDKPVVLVQDEKTNRIFDVSGINTISYNSTRLYEDVLDARERITSAIMSAKNGEQNSIVKVLNAQVASIDTGTMTREDKIEIMLSGLVKDVNDLKMQNRKGYASKNLLTSTGYWGTNPYEKEKIHQNLNSYINLNENTIVLKNGVTDKQIDKAIHELMIIYSVIIHYRRINKTLFLTIESNDWQTSERVFNELKNKFGDKDEP